MLGPYPTWDTANPPQNFNIWTNVDPNRDLSNLRMRHVRLHGIRALTVFVQLGRILAISGGKKLEHDSQNVSRSLCLYFPMRSKEYICSVWIRSYNVAGGVLSVRSAALNLCNTEQDRSERTWVESIRLVLISLPATGRHLRCIISGMVPPKGYSIAIKAWIPMLRQSECRMDQCNQSLRKNPDTHVLYCRLLRRPISIGTIQKPHLLK